MDLINGFLLCLMSCIIGAILMLLIQYVAFVKFFKAPAVETPHERAINEEFALPENIMCNVKSLDPDTKNSIIAFNLILQFLFYEERFSSTVRAWIYRKLTFELDELIAKTTISKFFDKFLLRDLDLGSQFPEIKNLRVHNVDLHETEGHIESLDVVMDLQYRGNFKVAIDGHMLLGKKVFLAVKVKQLSGLARLQFTRKPYSHWSVCFIGDPSLDLDIETLFQGRQLQQHLTNLLSHQIRKVVRRKHTLPTYKIRYRPFFAKCVDQLLAAAGVKDSAASGLAAARPASAQPLGGHLEVNISELSRLAVPANANHVFCTATMAAQPWVQVRQVGARTVAVQLEVRIQRAKNQQLGIMFKQATVDTVSVERVLPNTPATRSDLQANDILLCIEDRQVATIAQVSKCIKALAKREIVFRVERLLNGLVRNDNGCDEAFEEYADIDDGGTESLVAAAGTVKTALRKNSADVSTALPSGISGPAPVSAAASSESSLGNTPSSSPRKPAPPATVPTVGAAATTSPTASITAERDGSGHLLPMLGRKLSKSAGKSVVSSTGSEVSAETGLANRTGELLIADEILVQTASSTIDSNQLAAALNAEPPANILHQHTTINCLVNSLIKMNDLAHFELTAESKWLNICVYSRRNEETELLGYANVSVPAVLAESAQSTLWQLVKKLPLSPPTPANLTTHPLSNLKGFEPKLCFGDILLSFVWSGPATEDETVEKQQRTIELAAPGTHDFVRTQFNRSTQCEYCGKKIWLKDAVQCRRCHMSCHKKCVKKCQIFTVCGAAADSLSSPSPSQAELPLVGGPQQPVATIAATTSTQRPLVELRLTESENATSGGGVQMDCDGGPDVNCLQTGDQSVQPQQQQSSKNCFSDFLAQGIKRVNSVNNLAIPGMGGAGSQFTRSLPPSPQHTPRKQSLVNQSTNPFVGVVLQLEQLSDCVDDLEEEHIAALTQPLIGWGTTEELMGLAKTSSRSLYGELEPNDRVDKINILLVRLRIVLDVETTYFAQLSSSDAKTIAQDVGRDSPAHTPADGDCTLADRRRTSNASVHLSDEARKAFLIGQSEERVQALSVIMLHLCTGLQYAQGVATQ